MDEENLRRGHGRQALNRNYELDRPAMATVNAKKDRLNGSRVTSFAETGAARWPLPKESPQSWDPCEVECKSTPRSARN
jgi:hypothetical protein